jgi:hypothetical protein
MSSHHQASLFRRLILSAALIALAAGYVGTLAGAAEDDLTHARVRSTDPSLAGLIERATTQSATFRGLLAAIQQTNGMVQIETGRCGRSVRACLFMWMETAASNRFLRIAIDRRKGDSDTDVMASMGHELQHAVEALSESWVTDGKRLYEFFDRFATHDGGRFETDTALHIGDAVRNELRSTDRR